MSGLQLVILATIQGLAELLPVSSSAHVILAERLMGLDPAAPDRTFLLVMLHTGTMVAVLVYFGPRWRRRWQARMTPPRSARAVGFLWMTVVATACTGVIGLTLKFALERVVGWARLLDSAPTPDARARADAAIDRNVARLVERLGRRPG